ncbi:MAG: class I SAM-dependent methyltransferase [Acidimicrobiales bacterium]|nr:class I SAM-dependent methyltransferase [Acidimicrobiales bacterium]
MSTDQTPPHTIPSVEADLPVPNHHASHPGFSGVSGLAAGLGFLSGRGPAARLAVELADVGPDDRLVDIGCGPGVAVDLARRTGAEVIGVDPASVMLRLARLRWRGGPNVTWRVGAAEAVPVDDAWATVAWSLSTVHHWVHLGAGIDEVHRILVPGGRFVALERQIADPDAPGTPSHGWTPEQAESFAEHCRRRGFERVAVGRHVGRGPVLSVVAHRGADGSGPAS